MRISFHTFPGGWPYNPFSWLSYRRASYRIDNSYALMEGMRKHGDTPFIGSKTKPSDADVAALWSWKRPEITSATMNGGRRVLVMERGFVQPRNEWVSLAVDGFNGRGQFAEASDNGDRWERLFSHHLKSWREGGDYALLIGQVPGDPALNGTDHAAWVKSTAAKLLALGHKVMFRPHPTAPMPCPAGAVLSAGTLAENLSDAERVVAFSSTTAVEAVLAGIPTVVHDEGSIAFPMCSHDVAAPLVRPDRTRWCHNMAWRQWSVDELRNGNAWAHVRTLL